MFEMITMCFYRQPAGISFLGHWVWRQLSCPDDRFNVDVG